MNVAVVGSTSPGNFRRLNTNLRRAADAIAVIKRRAPCRHENVDTNLGNGQVWCRCEDCGTTLEQARVPAARLQAIEFEEAVSALENILGVSATETMEG